MATVPGPKKATKTVPKVRPASGAVHARWPWCRCPRPTSPTGSTDPRRSDVDEWGRSEHMRELARRVYGPLYRSWHRVEWEGLEKIPTDGGALLVSNHAGAIPADAPAIMHGIEEELGRPVYGLADEMFKRLPVVGTMWSRVGGVLAHPDNAYRLLREQEQLALVFPEGTKGTGKTYGERYQLRRFGRGGFVQIAMRAGVPVVPDRGRRRRGGHADPLEEHAAGQAARRPVRADHRQHARLRAARAAGRRAHAARPRSGSACSTRCTSTSSPTSRATRAA